MSLQGAGYTDAGAGVDDADARGVEPPVGEPTLAGNRLAEAYGISVPGFDPETPVAKEAGAK
jgi:NADH-quinone oxidoreductase subunit E